MTNPYIREPYRNTRNLNIEQKQMIKCPNCKAEAWNDPNNSHLENIGKDRDGSHRFREVRTREFADLYFCTKCTRATRVHTPRGVV